jgi:hypothetical protein
MPDEFPVTTARRRVGGTGSSRRAGRAANRGYITVVVAVLFGLAFTATVLGSAAYVRSTQALSMASHAQVQAQLKAWTGVEVVREYLAALQTSGNLTAMAGVVASAATPLSITGVSGVTATLTAVDSASSPTAFTASVTGTTASGTTAQATSTVQAVYLVSSSGSTNTPALNFNRNLVLGGSITIQKPTGSTTQYSINVLGDVSTSGNTISGVSVINSTGTINITSGSSFQTLNSNCDIVITGSVNVVSASAQRNICETGAAKVSGTALANGSVSSAAGFTANGTINARISPTPSASCSAQGYSGGSTTNASTCPMPAVTGVDLSAGGAGAAVVNTDGSVSLGSGGTIGTVDIAQNLTVGGGATVTSGTYGGSIYPAGTTVGATHVSPNTVTITPAVSVSLTTTQFNAYTLQTAANYAFTVNANGNAQVAVTNVSGETTGTYYIGQYTGGGYYDYLCASPTSTGTNITVTCGTGSPPAGALKICNGDSSYNSCFSYSSGTWTVASSSSITLAPGIAWFQGNLTLGGGTFYNTFVATGNIKTSGAVTVYAPNYAGYSGTAGGVTYAPTGVCTNSLFTSIYPTQFCTTSTSTYNASASSGLGNYAFLAGSWVGSTYPGQSGYVGGNIYLTGSDAIYGDIKAGNEFQSGSSTTIVGGVTALAQGVAAENNMGGSTTLNYTKVPATLDITGGASGTGGGASTSTVAVEWAHYL